MPESQQYPLNLFLIKDAGHILINLFFMKGHLKLSLQDLYVFNKHSSSNAFIAILHKCVNLLLTPYTTLPQLNLNINKPL